MTNEQDKTIRNQNQIILKVFRALQSKDRDELFCSDTDGQPLRCGMDCGARIDAVLSKTMKKQKIQEKDDDIRGDKAEDINETKDDNTIDDNHGENSHQGETSQTSNEQSLSDSMDSQES